jgi:predicted mannosyl-3-phosphoglycerate phosphatase (HAD superfamily)
VDCFRNAGLDPKQAAVIAERTLLHTLRAWQKACRQGWTGVLPQRDLESVRRQLAALEEENSILGAYFAENGPHGARAVRA